MSFLNKEERITYTVYHYLCLIAICVATTTTAICLKRKSRHSEHSTAIILISTFLFVNFFKSVAASALTIALLNFDVKLSDVHVIRTDLVIMALSIFLKLIILLIVADLGLKALLYKHYGNSRASIAICLVALIFMMVLSGFLAGAVMIFSKTGHYFLTYFKVAITLVQLVNIVSSLFLYYFVTNLRKKSITSSSLSVRHECGKNLVLLKLYFPMVAADAIIGTIGIITNLSMTYIFKTSPLIGFPSYYMFSEISTIFVFVSILRSLHRSGRVAIFNAIFVNEAPSTASTISVRTMTSRVPTAMSHDDYFRRLRKSWK